MRARFRGPFCVMLRRSESECQPEWGARRLRLTDMSVKFDESVILGALVERSIPVLSPLPNASPNEVMSCSTSERQQLS